MSKMFMTAKSITRKLPSSWRLVKPPLSQMSLSSSQRYLFTLPSDESTPPPGISARSFTPQFEEDGPPPLVDDVKKSKPKNKSKSKSIAASVFNHQQARDFWTSLLAQKATPAVVEPGVITLPKSWVEGELNPDLVYLRACDIEIYEEVMDARKAGKANATLLGTPGIGKTSFSAYVVYRESKEDKPSTIVYARGYQGAVILYPKGRVTVHNSLQAPEVLEALQHKDTIYIHDGYGPGEPLKVNAFTLLTCSPDESRYNEFKKNPKHGPVIYMPPWLLSEFLMFKAELGLSKKEIMARYALVGGSFRNLLESLEESRRSVKAAVLRIQLADFRLWNAFGTLPTSTHFHSILHAWPVRGGDFRSILKPCSPKVSDMIFDFAQTLATSQREDLAAILRTTAPSFYGNMFEQRVHETFSKKQTHILELTPLGEDDSIQLGMKVDASYTFADYTEVQKENVYYQPAEMHWPAIDSVFLSNNQVYAFQSTVSKQHPIHFGGMAALLNTFPNKIVNLIFVLPHEDLETFRIFKKQELTSVINAVLAQFSRQELLDLLNKITIDGILISGLVKPGATHASIIRTIFSYLKVDILHGYLKTQCAELQGTLTFKQFKMSLKYERDNKVIQLAPEEDQY